MRKKQQRIVCPRCGASVGVYRNPVPTVDVIIETKGAGGRKGIVLIRRKNEPAGFAIPGGFVDYGETLEEAALREAQEETGLKIAGLRQFRAYSDPRRDPRRHTISTVFTARGRGALNAGDDAAAAGVFSEGRLPAPLAFDHAEILRDYFREKRRAEKGTGHRKEPAEKEKEKRKPRGKPSARR